MWTTRMARARGWANSREAWYGDDWRSAIGIGIASLLTT